jgi:hypothetical protein
MTEEKIKNKMGFSRLKFVPFLIVLLLTVLVAGHHSGIDWFHGLRLFQYISLMLVHIRQ